MSENINIVHIEAIEGLSIQIGEHLNQITEENPEQREAKYKALEYLASFESNQVLELRRQFE